MLSHFQIQKRQEESSITMFSCENCGDSTPFAAKSVIKADYSLQFL